MNLGDGRLKLLGTGLAALWLTLGWQGAPADALTVTTANPTMGVGQTQQFRASGALTPTAVAGGGFHACMRLPDGTVQCWGRNNFGQLGNGDGNLADSSVPVPVRDLTTATRVVTGDSHTCALLGDGTVQCWGVGDSGQRGDGTFNNISSVPVAVVGMDGTGHLTNAVAIAARGYHSCALLGDGTVWCWGRNVEGQLGDGTTTSSSTPVRVGGITGAVAVSAGVFHTCALLSDGTVKCWGAVGPGNDFGQLGNGATTGSSTPVTVMGTGAVWTSSDPTVATIDASGRATGLSAGTATITATDGSGASASTTLIVTPAPVAPTITTQPASQTVTAGQTASFSGAAAGAAPPRHPWAGGGG